MYDSISMVVYQKKFTWFFIIDPTVIIVVIMIMILYCLGENTENYNIFSVPTTKEDTGSINIGKKTKKQGLQITEIESIISMVSS